MRIAMIGTGYVGLVSGACFSEFGQTVACVDQDRAKIARLQAGEVPIYEPGLAALVAANMAAGRLSFTTDLRAAVAGAEAVFIAVGTGIETSALIKYAANAFLATKITFINEIADLCEELGADVQDVARGIGLDGRIGRKFLHAGPGFGGSCFPKDCHALVRSAREAATDLAIVETVVQVNEARKTRMADKIIAACGGTVAGKTIAVLGLTFKPNTDDMRDSPSLAILPRLAAAGAAIRAFDPAGNDEARNLMPDLVYCEDAYEAAEGADALVLLTEWNEFRALDLARIERLLAEPLVIDLRNIYPPAEMAAAGLCYISVGRPPQLPRT